jgi:acetylornithine deacetylase/succinyl-diaminopimelate desuccinylase-like protein
VTAVGLAILICGVRADAAADAPAAVAQLLKQPAVKAAVEAAKASEAQTIDDEIRFCEVAAPPFKEAARAEVLRRAFLQGGLSNVRLDKAGNVIGDRPGAAAHPHLVIAAHLDTVFPEGTDVKVTRKGSVLRGPGIGDDCRGLATLIAVVRSLNHANVRTPGTVTFVANVGEEGLGDLRGMKQLFGDTMKGQIDRFVSIDGAGFGIMTAFVGSHRYRVTFKGSGGHAFADFGTASPIGALGRAVAKISAIQVPAQPRTTFNVGRVGGGTSINAIPTEAWMELEARSSDPSALAGVDGKLRQAVDSAVSEENERWGTPNAITVTRELVGDRAAGATDEHSPIVQIAIAVSRALDVPVSFSEGSSDANLPASLKIPAITLGTAGSAGNVHAPTEWFDTTDAWRGAMRAVLLTIALAQP